MEYPEEEETEAIVEQVLEASAAIPNIPTPKSSDGNVSSRVSLLHHSAPTLRLSAYSAVLVSRTSHTLADIFRVYP